MNRTEDFAVPEDPDETLVTPRFDRDEAETARPVVPLAVVSGEAETYAVSPDYAAAMPDARRRSWPLALVLASALAGVVLGGAGLYFYQKRGQVKPPAAEASAAPETTEQAIAPAPTPDVTAGLSAEPLEEVETMESVAAVAVAGEAKEEKKDAGEKRDESKREDADWREKPVADEGAFKRGKKGERELEPEPSERRPRRVGERAPAPPRELDERDDDETEARRVDSITYGGERRRERRRQRREERRGGVDRVRGIFEGQPPN